MERFEGSFKRQRWLGGYERPSPWRDGEGALTVGEHGLTVSGPGYGWRGSILLAGLAVMFVLAGVLPKVMPALSHNSAGSIAFVLFLAFWFIGSRRRAERTQELSWGSIRWAKVSGDGHAVVRIGRFAPFMVKFMPTGGDPHPVTAAITARLHR